MQKSRYQYWVFYIKPEYAEKIAFYTLSSELPYLYAYTDNKSLYKKFLQIHKKESFIIKKMSLSKDEVNDLARNMQNHIIREYTLNSKTNDFESMSVTICMTEKEYMRAETTSYQAIDSMWKYMWSKGHLDRLNKSYYNALRDLKFEYFQNSLEKGATFIVSGLESDILSSFISIYNPILEVKK